MEPALSSKDEWIKLNVGGTIFNTTMDTLLKSNTMLSKMFASNIPKKKDENGCVLIDRDGKHFDKILNYLRNEILPLLKDENEVNEVLIEADYYCIEKLKNHCQTYGSPKEVKMHSFILNEYIPIFYNNNGDAFQNLLRNISIDDCCSIPLLPDATMSYPFLKVAFKREVDKYYSRFPRSARDSYNAARDNHVWRSVSGIALDAEKSMKNLEVKVIYWKNCDGMPEEKKSNSSK